MKKEVYTVRFCTYEQPQIVRLQLNAETPSERQMLEKLEHIIDVGGIIGFEPVDDRDADLFEIDVPHDYVI